MPTFIVSLAVVAGLQAGFVAALVVALLGAIAIGIFAERRLARIISSFDRIARGDRYTTLPTLLGDGAIQGFAGTAETVRAALIEADTLTVDQLRRETEARLHHAGRLFFTGNFRHAVEEVVNAFTTAGARIRGTAAELVQSNRQMANQVTAGFGRCGAGRRADVAGVAAAARDVETLVMNSAQQVDDARAATKRTTTELARADATMRRCREPRSASRKSPSSFRPSPGRRRCWRSTPPSKPRAPASPDAALPWSRRSQGTVAPHRQGDRGSQRADHGIQQRGQRHRRSHRRGRPQRRRHGQRQREHQRHHRAADHPARPHRHRGDEGRVQSQRDAARHPRRGHRRAVGGRRRAVDRGGSDRPRGIAGEFGEPLLLRPGSRLDQGGHPAFAVGHADRERTAAAAVARDDDREAQPARRPARPSGRSRHHGSALRHRRLRRPDAQAAASSTRSRRSSAAGRPRRASRCCRCWPSTTACCFIRANTKARSSRRTSSIPARRRSSRRCRRSIICWRSAASAFFWSAPITSIRARPMRSSAIIWPQPRHRPRRGRRTLHAVQRKELARHRPQDPQVRRPRRLHHRDAVRRRQCAFLPRARAPGPRCRRPAGDEPVAGRSGNAGAVRTQSDRPHGGLDLSAHARHAGKPRLHRRVARLHRRSRWP